MLLRTRTRWLLRHPWWWLAQVQTLASFALALAPSMGLAHRIAAAVYGLMSNIIATRAMVIEPPRTPVDRMTERQRSKLFREHPEARQRWLKMQTARGVRTDPAPTPPPLPPAPDEEKKGP